MAYPIRAAEARRRAVGAHNRYPTFGAGARVRGRVGAHHRRGPDCEDPRRGTSVGTDAAPRRAGARLRTRAGAPRPTRAGALRPTRAGALRPTRAGARRGT